MKSTFPTLSIIIPVYNVDRYLCDCINSIMRLNLPHYEVIMVDDGSKDSSGAICDEFARSYQHIRVIHQSNAGVSAARNKGLSSAQGKWIWFVDADDAINSKLEYKSIIERIEGTDYAMFDLERFDDGAPIPSPSDVITTFSTLPDKNTFLVKYVCDCHPMLWYRRSVIEEFNIRFPEGIRITEDLEFQFKYLMHCQKPIKINAVSYFYRQREGSSIHQSISQTVSNSDSLKVMQHLLEHMKAHKIGLEPWLTFRLELFLLRSCLLTAVNNKNLRETTKISYRNTITAYRGAGYKFPRKVSFKLAYNHFNLYMALFKINDQIKRLIGLR